MSPSPSLSRLAVVTLSHTRSIVPHRLAVTCFLSGAVITFFSREIPAYWPIPSPTPCSFYVRFSPTKLLGMADSGFLPKFFGLRSKWFNTPWVGILLSTAITIGVSHMDFTDIISSANLLYSLGMLLEFASFVWLRRKYPAMKRPFKVPMGIPGLVVMCPIPSGFLVLIMAIATETVYLVSGLMTAGSIAWYFLVNYCKPERWFASMMKARVRKKVENASSLVLV